ncbi:uncharacterized protein LOC132036600 [Lycium ferocissimum]|uniref:uncharacterized protein LOC132036600 n=1 Tax=Lycium ferocissimum TaxID=112874 RepID=UPI0028165F95|nr:uncharacterized protein LOC132036600 [Lycium ferocissimum]
MEFKVRPHRTMNRLNNSRTFIPRVLYISIHQIIQDLCTGKVLGIGKEKEGLYLLPSTKQPAFVTTLGSTSRQCFSSSTQAHPSIWHMRFGHAPVAVLQKITTLQPLLQNKTFSPCTVCPLARQTRFPFPTSTSKTTCIFELLHMDVWGSYKQCTYNGHKYFLTIVDD